MNLAEAEDFLESMASRTQAGVYHCENWGMSVERSTVTALEVLASSLPGRKARLCMHPSLEDPNQQMLVAIHRDCGDEIHFHPRKDETVVWVEGSADHHSYDAQGNIEKSVRLSEERFRYVSTKKMTPHNVVVVSEVFVFWEFGYGPFRSDSTVSFVASNSST